MTAAISQRVKQFLDENFPGSSIEDGYAFVAIRSNADVFVRHDCRQRIADKLCENRCVLVTVGADPRGLVGNADIEERQIDYNPDWDVHVDRPQWLVELPATRIDLSALFDVATSPGAIALIDVERRLVLDVHLRVLHAPSDEALARFMEDFRDCVAEHDHGDQ